MGASDEHRDLDEFVGGWKLRLQAEVKRNSSLPSSMFDACDPMLEAALAESAAQIFVELMSYGPPPGFRYEPDHDLPVEHVEPADIRTLSEQLATEPRVQAPELYGSVESEHLWILLDLSLADDEVARARAASWLRARLGRDIDLHSLERQLLEKLHQRLGGTTPEADRAVQALGAELDRRRRGEPGDQEPAP